MWEKCLALLHFSVIALTTGLSEISSPVKESLLVTSSSHSGMDLVSIGWAWVIATKSLPDPILKKQKQRTAVFPHINSIFHFEYTYLQSLEILNSYEWPEIAIFFRNVYWPCTEPVTCKNLPGMVGVTGPLSLLYKIKQLKKKKK